MGLLCTLPILNAYFTQKECTTKKERWNEYIITKKLIEIWCLCYWISIWKKIDMYFTIQASMIIYALSSCWKLFLLMMALLNRVLPNQNFHSHREMQKKVEEQLRVCYWDRLFSYAAHPATRYSWAADSTLLALRIPRPTIITSLPLSPITW